MTNVSDISVDEDLVTEWIEALRSTRYVRGKGRLRNRDNRFCPFGVLCDIYSTREGVQARWVLNDFSQYRMEFNGPIIFGVTEDFLPPDELMYLVGLVPDNAKELKLPPITFDCLICYNIDYANDSGATFSVIAEYLQNLQKQRLYSEE